MLQEIVKAETGIGSPSARSAVLRRIIWAAAAAIKKEPLSEQHLPDATIRHVDNDMLHRVDLRNATNRDVTIYALIDPRDGRVRYVGRTMYSVAVRLQSHKTDFVNKPKIDWLTELEQNKTEPIVKILEVTTTANAKAAELQWIKHFLKIYPDLTNVQRQ